MNKKCFIPTLYDNLSTLAWVVLLIGLVDDDGTSADITGETASIDANFITRWLVDLVYRHASTECQQAKYVNINKKGDI
jgi:hypothetical protein